MRVIVRVFGDISAIIGKRHELELTEGATINTVAKSIGEKTQQRQGYLSEFVVGGKDLGILVNGRSIDMLSGAATILRDGDEVVIMQPTHCNDTYVIGFNCDQ